MEVFQAPSFLPGFFCCEDRNYLCLFLIVPYFFHFLGPFFQICGSECDTVLLAEAVFFHGILFLVEKGGNVEG